MMPNSNYEKTFGKVAVLMGGPSAECEKFH